MKLNRFSLLLLSLILIVSFNNCGRFDTVESFTPGFEQTNLNSTADDNPQQPAPQPNPQTPMPQPNPQTPMPNPQPQPMPTTTGKWANEPAGSVVHFDCEFNDTLCGMASRYNTVAFATVLGDRVLNQFIPASTTVLTGNGQWGLDFPKQRQIYVGFDWSTNPDFMGLENSGNKVIFIKNPDAAPGARDNSLLNWYGARCQPKTLLWHQQGEVNNCHISEYSTNACWPVDGTGLFYPNVNRGAATVGAGTGKHRIEIYMKASTTSSSKDGIIRHWVDGVMTSNFTTVNLSSEGFTNVEITATWDGSSNLQCGSRDCSKEWNHYFHNLHVSFPK